MVREIYVIDNTDETINLLKQMYKNTGNYKFKNFNVDELEYALKNIPDLIIINEDTVSDLKYLKQIRADEDNMITPIIVLSSREEKEHIIEVMGLFIEYYLIKNKEIEYLQLVINNIIRLIYTNRRVSPLTGLPGNVQIQAELKKRVQNKESFSVLYFDLDNFKAYNDVYGFLKGDEILKFTGKTIVGNVHKDTSENNFIGHIGGDDFVAIVDTESAENICQGIIAEFDANVLSYFTKDDAEKGYLEVPNRKGVTEEFPLTSLSIGVVQVNDDMFENILEIGEVGAQVKHAAKTVMGSSYVINKRGTTFSVSAIN